MTKYDSFQSPKILKGMEAQTVHTVRVPGLGMELWGYNYRYVGMRWRLEKYDCAEPINS